MNGKEVKHFMEEMTEKDRRELTGDELKVPSNLDAGTLAAFVTGKDRVLVFDVDTEDIVGFVTRHSLPDPADWTMALLRSRFRTCTCTECEHEQLVAHTTPGPPYECEKCGKKTCEVG